MFSPLFYRCKRGFVLAHDNLFADLPSAVPDELTEILASSDSVRIERIVSTGHSTRAGSWYDQDEHEWVVVLKGNAKLAFENAETIDLTPGDHVNIPAHRRHRVESTALDEPTVWLAVFYRD